MFRMRLLGRRTSRAIAGALMAAASWTTASAAPVPAAGAPAVTFTRDIAPILLTHCASCHRPGGSAPFSLLTYADARRRARLIATVTERRVMPPWQPLPEGPRFQGERRLDAEDIRRIARWVEDGTPEGEARALPPAPVFTNEWQLGTPDLVVSMPEPFEVPAGGPDFFRNFVLPVPPRAGRYVQAIEFRPGNARVVHHARVLVDDTGESHRHDAADPQPGFGGMDTPGARFPDGYFLGWAPGKRPKREATAWPLAPGTDLVVQLHLRPSGRAERVQASVGLYFTDTPPAFTPVMLQMGARTLDIAAGDQQYLVTDSYVLPVAARAVRIAPHAHYLAREMQLRATRPGETPLTLLHIPDWNFNWQDDYDYTQPVELPAGTRLEMRFTYDNSPENPRNPNTPPRRVTFGSQASDEMCELLLQLVPAAPEDLPRLRADINRKSLEIETAEAEKRVVDQPEDADARTALGAIYIQTGRFDQGAREFEAAVRLAPDQAVTNYNAGQVAFARRDYDLAQRRLERAIALRPELVEAHTTLAELAERRGDDTVAAARYRAALALRPGHVPAAANLARVLIARGAWDDTIAMLEDALRAQPREPVLLDALAAATTGAGRQRAVLDLDGAPVTTQVAGARAVVMVFVGTDCPVSNRYAPEVRRLAERFAPSGISFVTVYPNPAETAATIRQHLKDYGLPPRAVHDREQALVARSGVTITPEVVVYDARGRMVYRGRIDDRYTSVGVERPTASRHDLEEVLSAIIAGRTPPLRTTSAVGCFIADTAR